MSASDHYDEVSGSYERAVFYDPGSPYHAWLVERVAEHLDLAPEHRLVDIGGGAGGFAQELREHVGLEPPVRVVEPSALAEVADERDGLIVRQAGALEFALDRTAEPCERILMKEVVHHLPEERLDTLYEGLHERLTPEGVLVTVTRPVEPALPLFEAAKEVWREQQPPWEQFAAEQRAAGFTVAQHTEAYPFALPRERWVDMIRARCWSTFSAFDDDALEAGVAEVEEVYPEVVRFEDQLIVLVAQR